MGPPADDLLALESVTSASERNAIALRLADARTPGLEAALARLIQRPDLEDYKGTLVYCLGIVGADRHIGLLCNQVANGRYEAANEAFDVLCTIEGGQEADIATGEAFVRQALERFPMEDWRRDLLEKLQEAFE